MKKFKLLPSIIMIIACFAVLGMGVYSASSQTRNIKTTITISAAGAVCELTAYLNNTSSSPISNTAKVRNGIAEVNITPGALRFSGACFVEELEPIDLIIGIKNTSDINLGAYFAKSATASGEANIETPRYLSGTTSSGTLPNAVYLEFGEYTEIPVGETAYITCTITAKELAQVPASVELNLIVNIEESN